MKSSQIRCPGLQISSLWLRTTREPPDINIPSIPRALKKTPPWLIVPPNKCGNSLNQYFFRRDHNFSMPLYLQDYIIPIIELYIFSMYLASKPLYVGKGQCICKHFSPHRAAVCLTSGPAWCQTGQPATICPGVPLDQTPQMLRTNNFMMFLKINRLTLHDMAYYRVI